MIVDQVENVADRRGRRHVDRQFHAVVAADGEVRPLHRAAHPADSSSSDSRVSRVNERMPRSVAVVPPFSPIEKSEPLSARPDTDPVLLVVDLGQHHGPGPVEDIEQILDRFSRLEIDDVRLVAVGDLQSRV